MTETVEDIPDGDAVSRLIDFPRMYEESKGLIWDQVFLFPGGAPESLVWRKYAPKPGDVHRLGCEREAAKRQSKPEMRYTGFIPSTAGAVRAIKTKRGHGFTVSHAPKEGKHHAEVRYAPAGRSSIKILKPADKAELKAALKNVFGQLVPHSCASTAVG